MKANRVCLTSGYKFEYAHASSRGNWWRTDSDSQWDIVSHKVVCGKLLGRRRIDGAQVAVVRAGGKIYASQYIKTPKGVQMAGARRRRRR